MNKKSTSGSKSFKPSVMFGDGPTTENIESRYPDYFLKESEKYDDDKNAVKRIFNYHRSLALPMMTEKRLKYEKNYKMAFGFIDPVDYGLQNDEYIKEFKLLNQNDDKTDISETVQLEFFPILPNMVDSLKQELLRKYNRLIPRLVDSESINEAITLKQQAIIDTLVKMKQTEFESKLDPAVMQNQEEYQKAMQEFQSLPEVEKYYKFKYKPEIVQWAEHRLERDHLKFDMDELSKDVFEDQLIVGERFLHVETLFDGYQPEYLYPSNCAYAKSPLKKCVSESVWFYWEEFLSAQGIITKFGSIMEADDIEALKKYIITSELTVNDENSVPRKWNNYANTRNLMAIQNLITGDVSTDRMNIKVCHQYFLLPRKLAKLTVRVRLEDNSGYEDIYTDNIDPEFYEIRKKPVYKNGTQDLDNLIEGEHLDYFYINEVWRGIKINYNNSTAGFSATDLDQNRDIWIYLDKVDYQGMPEDELYGTVIPVFGGKTNFKMEQYNKSLIDLVKPYQVYYNYLMNKIKELVITELMPFYIINQGILGANSQDESWKDNALFKFIHAGQEVGLSVGSTEGGSFALNGIPVSQLINPDRSIAIKTRMELATLFKNEAMSLIGISPQFLGDIKPSETAAGVTQGINRSLNQLQNLFDDHYSLLKRAKRYMIEVAQIKTYMKGERDELSYVDSEGVTQLFTIEANRLPLTRKIGLFLTDSVKANDVLERMRQLAMMDNTMGADAYEKMLILRAESDASLLALLKQERDERDKKEQAASEQQNQMNSQNIQANQEAQMAKQQFEAEQNQLDREADILIAQIKSIGMTKNPDSNSNSQFDASEILKHTRENTKMSNDLLLKNKEMEFAKNNKQQELLLKQQDLNNKRNDSYNNYMSKLKDIDARLKMKQIDYKIAETNRNKYDSKKKPKK